MSSIVNTKLNFLIRKSSIMYNQTSSSSTQSWRFNLCNQKHRQSYSLHHSNFNTIRSTPFWWDPKCHEEQSLWIIWLYALIKTRNSILLILLDRIEPVPPALTSFVTFSSTGCTSWRHTHQFPLKVASMVCLILDKRNSTAPK